MLGYKWISVQMHFGLAETRWLHSTNCSPYMPTIVLAYPINPNPKCRLVLFLETLQLGRAEIIWEDDVVDEEWSGTREGRQSEERGYGSTAQ